MEMKKCYKQLLLMMPWFIFIVIWNYNWPEATSFDDVFASTCLYFFNRKFTGRFLD